MSVNNVQGINVAPMAQNAKQTVANKASNFFKAFSEKEVNDTIVLSKGREEKNGKLTLASKATQALGVFSMLLAIPKLAAKEAKGKSGAMAMATLGAIGVLAGTILNIVNKADAKKAMVNPPVAEETPQIEETPIMEQPIAETPAAPAEQTTQQLPAGNMPAAITAPAVETPQIAQQFAPIDAKINEIAATV